MNRKDKIVLWVIAAVVLLGLMFLLLPVLGMLLIGCGPAYVPPQG